MDTGRRTVLVVCDVTGHGGVSTYLAHVAKAARHAGWDARFLLDDGPGARPVADYLREHRVAFHQATIRRDRNGDSAAARSFDRFLGAVEPTVVHAVLGSPRSALVPREVSLRRGYPLVITEQYVATDIAIDPDVLSRVKEVHRRASAVIFVSRENQALGRDHFGLVPERALVIPNSVRLPPASHVPDRLPAGGIITVARLTRQKGLDVLVDALALLNDTRLHLRIVGDGELRRSLEERAAAGLAGQVSFLGWRDDVAELLRSADLFVLPSRAEGQPFALLEAMAAGVPCIASAVSGIPEALGDGAFGTLVPPNCPVALAHSIQAFFRDPGHHRVKARSALDHLQRNHCDCLNAKRLTALWNEVAHNGWGG